MVKIIKSGYLYANIDVLKDGNRAMQEMHNFE